MPVKKNTESSTSLCCPACLWQALCVNATFFLFNSPLCDKSVLTQTWVIFTARSHASTVYAVIVCPSVTSQYCTKTAKCKNWHTPPSLCALAFHNRRQDCNVDVCVNIVDDPFVC